MERLEAQTDSCGSPLPRLPSCLLALQCSAVFAETLGAVVVVMRLTFSQIPGEKGGGAWTAGETARHPQCRHRKRLTGRGRSRRRARGIPAGGMAALREGPLSWRWRGPQDGAGSHEQVGGRRERSTGLVGGGVKGETGEGC